jgi:hypothetical protein
VATISVSPASATIAAGGSQAYTASAVDAYGNSLGAVTGSTNFTISPDGSCSGASCSATTAGSHTVTGTDSGKSDTSSLSVTPGPIAALVVSPASATITAGGSQAYSANAIDAYGNSLGDVTGSTTFTIGPDGSCTGANCTGTLAGTDTVTGTDSGAGATASLTVTAGPFDHIVVSPASATISSGGSQDYTAAAFDSFNNPLGDVTGSTAFTIGPDGSCTGASCTATIAGAHTVTGTDSGKTDTASLSVISGVVPTLTIIASSASMNVGDPVPTISPSYSGFVNGDDASSLTVLPACSTTATPSSAAGNYPSTCTGAVDPNYTIAYVDGTVSVQGAFRIITTTIGPAHLSSTYVTQLQAVGGVGKTKWKVTSGKLPAGLKMTGKGQIKGSLFSKSDTTGTFTFTVTAQDHRKATHGGPQHATQTYTLTVS